MTTEERITGIEIVRKLQNFYQITDAQIQNSNFFTKLLNWIRDYFSTALSNRNWLEDTDCHFRSYSETKFLQTFGGAFDGMGNHPASDGSAYGMLAKEDRIRALLTHA